MPIALAEQGQIEVPGDADNPRIVEYLKSTTLPPELAAQDETAWCSAFVNWCVEHSGHKGTRSAAARSWLEWGKAISIPRRGCIAVFSRGESSGHVAFYMCSILHNYIVLGGNQANRVGVNDYDRARLLGFRVPL